MTGSAALSGRRRPVLRDDAPAADDFRADVLRGLAGARKTLPCKYFYDERGAELFERICELEAYYLTRVERGILREHIVEIAERLGPRCRVVEFGSGAGSKTRFLLTHLDDPVAYVPVDISREQLVETAARLAAVFPRLEVQPVCADYTSELELPEPRRRPERDVVFFPGSTIGNFEPTEVLPFLERVARLVRHDGLVLIGVDRRKDAAVLERAYDDSEGVTAEFNLNLLTRINRELGADFDLDGFAHHARYDADAGRVEMHLLSLVPQAVRMPDGRGGATEIRFAAGETIETERSYKYTVAGVTDLASRAGLHVDRVWSDAGERFSLYLLRA